MISKLQHTFFPHCTLIKYVNDTCANVCVCCLSSQAEKRFVSHVQFQFAARYRCRLILRVHVHGAYKILLFHLIQSIYRIGLHIRCNALHLIFMLFILSSRSLILYRTARKIGTPSFEQFNMANEIDIINILVRVRIPLNFSNWLSRKDVDDHHCRRRQRCCPLLFLFNGWVFTKILCVAAFCSPKIWNIAQMLSSNDRKTKADKNYGNL